MKKGKDVFELQQILEYKIPNTDLKIIKVVKGNSKYISNLERKYHKTFRKYKYVPQIYFTGTSECFKW